MHVYVLSLENGNYYVGKTNKLDEKLQHHRDGYGSAWTTTHKMLDVEEVIETDDPFEEERYLMKYFNTYGIDHVRGGIYSSVDLTMEQILEIEKSLCHANTRCFACKSDAHQIEECQELICYRCGRHGHLAENCQEKIHLYHGRLDGCYRCGRETHWAFRCNRSKDIFGRIIKQKNLFFNILRM